MLATLSSLQQTTRNRRPMLAVAEAVDITPSGGRSRLRLLVSLMLMLWLSGVAAIEQVSLELAQLEGQGLQANHLALTWTLQADHTQLDLSIAEVIAPTLPFPLKDLKLSCGKFYQTAEILHCQQGTFSLAGQLLDSAQNTFSFQYHLNTQQAQLNIARLNFAQGQIRADIHYRPDAWGVTAHINQLDLQALADRLKPVIALLPQDYSLGGQVNIVADVNGKQTLIDAVKLNGTLNDFSFSDPTATQVAEGLNLALALDAKQAQTVWTVTGDTIAKAGEVYYEPIYFAINQPINMSTALEWDAPILLLKSLRYQHPDVLTVENQARIRIGDTTTLESLSVNVPKTALQPIYADYLASWLETLKFGDLDTDGELSVNLQWQPGFQQLIARLHQIDIEDKHKSFGLFGLDGQLNWQVGAPRPRATHLTWLQGYFLSNIEIGNSYLHALLNDNTIRLLTPLYQPILDGALEIDSFTLNNLGQQAMQGQMQGRLSPISMQALSQALSLPLLTGSVAGQIPTVNYKNRIAHVDGSIKVKVFEGEMVIRQLRVSNLLGRLPLLTGHIDIEKFNLARVTEVFKEFGAIQGHLSGKLHNLRLLNWAPVSFDAYVGTPDDNSLPRKISQTAVRNLSNIGGSGGVVDTISQHVLSLFENFSYDRLGLGCRLENGVCHMSGAAPIAGGYYIVKGGSIPRIDVIGYNQKVDWNELLQRIETLSQAQTPVIQ